MKKRIICIFIVCTLLLCTACGKDTTEDTTSSATVSSSETTTVTTTVTETETTTVTETTTEPADSYLKKISATDKIVSLESGMSVSQYTGDYGLDLFLSSGGASSDEDVVSFLLDNVIKGNIKLSFKVQGLGCSTISVPGKDGGNYFGRNFDWKKCDALVLKTNPKSGYKSISTVNTSFLTSNTDYELTDDILRFASIYAPLDGMNEKGVCVSVNMINDSGSTISQDTSKPDITTTTAIRMILDKAATTDEAVNLLKKYDMHASFGYMIHYAITDAKGNSVAVEYIGNKIYVTETPVLTNFYITEGSKYGVGSSQSVERYNILMNALEKNEKMSAAQVRDALSSVSKKNFNEFESTEWSAVFDQKNLTVTYFHRENYKSGYKISL